ncbi:MAG: helix-turn-helix domain-containing protein [Gammaproteobacteria bacterium]|nr:helix-turn-helix domain-containing protein [Gammaproteobacteria bacterium]MDH5618661.1 helix-turn-helix domain-containing protein [Gammaproteobacteria bacterium]
MFWRLKSKPGRPVVPPEVQQLIRRMALDNPTWGEERIAHELLLKLGLRLSPRTVRKYMPERPSDGPNGGRADQRWATFVRNHAEAIVACDFFAAGTASLGVTWIARSSASASEY